MRAAETVEKAAAQEMASASVLTFTDPDEALRLANDITYGLAATVWSKNIDVALRTARGIRAGTVAVNGYGEDDITTPFGAYRQSGFGGRENGLGSAVAHQTPSPPRPSARAIVGHAAGHIDAIQRPNPLSRRA